ncbi:MAG TPA: hypothetical protein VIL71_07875, partial [Spirillospora sp.]
SIARSAPAAQRLAAETAAAGMTGTDWCTGGPSVTTDVSDWRPGGRVGVTITCDVDLGDLSFIGLPGTKRLQGHAIAPIDTFTYRGTDAGPAEPEDAP